MKALTTLLTDIADAIREKKGTTELINPQDFSTEIRGISGGGNAGRTIYVKLNGDGTIGVEQIFASLMRGTATTYNGEVKAVVVPFMYAIELQSMGAEVTTQAYSINLDDIITMDGVSNRTIEEELIAMKIIIDELPQITKEQFYDLTTEI